MLVSFQINFTNVIGVLKGERFGNVSDKIVGVGAHYDTVKTTAGTVLPAKSDSDVMFCLQSYQRLRIDRSLVY